MIFLRGLVCLALLGSATLIFQQESQPVTFAVLGAFHIIACIAILIDGVLDIHSMFMYIPIMFMNLLTFAAIVSTGGLHEAAWSNLFTLGIICILIYVRREL